MPCGKPIHGAVPFCDEWIVKNRRDASVFAFSIIFSIEFKGGMLEYARNQTEERQFRVRHTLHQLLIDDNKR
jgi:hypothetical protein